MRPFQTALIRSSFADDALPVSDQVFQQIEYLWCNGNDLCAAMQFAPVDVKCELLEAIAQVANPSQCPSYAGKASSHAPRLSRWYAKCKPMVEPVLSRGISLMQRSPTSGWVKRRPSGAADLGLFNPQQRTSEDYRSTFDNCQFRTGWTH